MRWQTHVLTTLTLLTFAALTEPLCAQEADRAAQLAERIDVLEKEGKFAEAIEPAKELLALARADSKTKAYELADAERRVATLNQIASLSQPARMELVKANSLNDSLTDLFIKGQYRAATDIAKRQLEVYRRHLGDVDSYVALCLNNLGLLAKYQGDYTGAEPLYRDALAMRRKLLGDEHPEVALGLNNIAQLLLAQGDYAGAEPLLRAALAMYRKLLGDESPNVASSINNLAALLYLRGDYAGAEPLYREALSMRRKLLGSEHREVAESLNNLAVLLFAQGDYAGAEPLYREALAMRRKLLGNEHPDVAKSLNNVARLLEAQGDYAGAEALYLEALAMWRKLYGDEHPDVAIGLNGLAMLFQTEGEYDKAEPLQREALAIWRKLLGNEHPNVATGLNNLAGLVQARGDLAGAELLFREGLTMRQKLLGDEHPDVAGSLNNIASLLYSKGDYAGAEPLLVHATDTYDAARLRAGSGIARASFQSSPYPRLASVRLALQKVGDVWPAEERSLGLALGDLLFAADERRLSPSENSMEDSLQQTLAGAERELAVRRRSAASDTSAAASARIEEARNRLLSAQSEWSSFQQAIAQKYPVSEGRAFSLEHVQRALKKNEAILGWLDVSWKKDTLESWAYVVRNRGAVEWVRVVSQSGEPGLRQRLLRDALTIRALRAVGVQQGAQGVEKERVAPIMGALDGVTDLIVISSGPMLGIPVEALMDEDGRFLADRYVVSYIPSATIHTWLRERLKDQTHKRAGKMLLVGDPAFRETELVAQEGAGRSAESVPPLEAATVRSVVSGNDEALASLPSLPATRTEVKVISAMASESTVLLGVDASEQNLRRLAETDALKKFDVIHLATHALVDSKNPERSALVLSQVDLPNAYEAAAHGDPIFTGLLTALDIVRDWKLEADIVTLSACETGLGKEVSGEGYVGFMHAFLQAGARSLLVSLWKVDDQATSLLMQRFYENYFRGQKGKLLWKEPMTKAQALQEAKYWLRNYTNDGGAKPYSHPAYWAAFILVGDRG